MDSPEAEPFCAAVRCIAGLGSKGQSNDSLMSSLPSELVFNDMRDTCRRAKKSDRTTPSNLHSVACRSVAVRTKASSTVELATSDWSSDLPHGQKGAVKASVLSALRSTDVSLGVDCNGLTRQKNNKSLTKPHHFVARFQAFDLLAEKWHNTAGDMETKETAVHDAAKAMWICKLFTSHVFIRVQGPDGFGGDDGERLLMISSGPNAIKALKLTYSEADQCFILASKSMAKGCVIFLLQKMDAIQVPFQVEIHSEFCYISKGVVYLKSSKL